MKKVFTVAVASLVTLLSIAADNPRDGRLRISNFSRMNILVVVDGRVINDRDDHMLIGGLAPGYHNVKVYRQERGRRNRGGIFGGVNRGALLFNSSVYVTPQAEVRVIVDRGGQVMVDRQRGRNGRDRRYYDGDYGRGPRDRNWR